MDDCQLANTLRSLGKEVFVKYFCVFADTSLSREDVTKTLRKEGYAKKSSRTKASNARRIIDAGRAKKALMIISKSRVPAQVAERARKLAMAL